MLARNSLHEMAQARIEDARVLIRARRYGGAAYLVGYAIEYRLKARVATRLLGRGRWPESKEEFDLYRNLQSHKLDQLLRLSGREKKVKLKYQGKWSLITSNWGPDVRYKRVGAITKKTAIGILEAVERLMEVL